MSSTNDYNAIYMTERTGPLKLRMPEEIKDWLYLASKKTNRSMSREIMFVLRESLKKEYSPNAIKLFASECPTGLNGEGIGIRFDIELKEALKNVAKANGNSLNQEMVMRLYFAKRETEATAPALTVVKNMMVKDASIEISYEDKTIIKLLSSLSEKNKKAVINLIRDLSD